MFWRKIARLSEQPGVFTGVTTWEDLRISAGNVWCGLGFMVLVLGSRVSLRSAPACLGERQLLQDPRVSGS